MFKIQRRRSKLSVVALATAFLALGSAPIAGTELSPDSRVAAEAFNAAVENEDSDPKRDPKEPQDPEVLATEPDPIVEANFTLVTPTLRAIDEFALSNDPDYFKVEWDRREPVVTLYRKGKLPAALNLAYRNLVQLGVTLNVKQSPLSRVQKEASQKAISAAFEKFVERKIQLAWWGVFEPDDIFVIQYDPSRGTRPDLGTIRQLSGVTREMLPDDLIRIEEGYPEPLTRENDTSPYYGGGRIKYTETNRICSTGFGVRNNFPNYYMTTAWHCMRPNNLHLTGGGRGIGYITEWKSDIDVALIDASGFNGRTDRFVFNGGYPNNTSTIRVNGVATPYLNQPVCLSGSVAYASCDAFVSETFDTWGTINAWNGASDDAHGLRIYNKSGRNMIAAQGDSGGPIYQRVENNTRATAVGGVNHSNAGWTAVCPDRISNSNPNTRCFWGVNSTNMSEAAAYFTIAFNWN